MTTSRKIQKSRREKIHTHKKKRPENKKNVEHAGVREI